MGPASALPVCRADFPKLHFVDPALAAAVASTSAQRLMHDLPTAWLWFESQVVQHLRVFAEALGGRTHHYRDKADKAGKEADAVVELDDGRRVRCSPCRADGGARQWRRRGHG